jgi:hypothetical protein
VTAGTTPDRFGSTPKLAIPLGRVPAEGSVPPLAASVAEVAKYPASVEVQLSVLVTGPLATGKLPLAATLPNWSLTAQLSLSADGALVVKAIWNVLPEANMRVASALGVSAEMSAPPAAALEVTGAWHDIVSPGLALTVVLALLPLPLLLAPAALEPFAATPVPLLEVALLLLDALPLDPPPPPPQPASTSTREESTNGWSFIDQAEKV